MVCKEKAIRFANENHLRKVYFISVVGTYKNGNPRREPFMFDIFTKTFDMKNTDAIPIDITDLIAYYDKHHPTFVTVFDESEPIETLRMKKIYRSKRLSDISKPLSELSVYELIEFFIKNEIEIYENSHFIIDEVPILYQSLTGKI